MYIGLHVKYPLFSSYFIEILIFTKEFRKILKYQVLTFCWPFISVYLSQYLTNLMQIICFTMCFISCLYMFRAHVLIIRRSKLHYTASGIITPIGVMIPEAV